ncbi:glycosyltransferase [Patescibacteria group bacterium]|nr:glycosyltransferase [Patescibacteria group bacterium]
MRIAILTNAYPPEARGGAGRIAALQVGLLRARGHEVRVFVTSLAWTSRPAWQRVFFHLRDLVWIHPLATEIIAWQPAVVLSHNLTGGGFRTPSAVQKKGIRWVHLLHDVQLFEPLGLLADEMPITSLQKIVTCLRSISFGSPDVVLSPTNWLLQAHMRRGWFKDIETRIVPNPAPDYRGSSQADWHTPLRLTFVGRVSADKGANLLRAIIERSQRSIIWQVVGSGSESLQDVMLPTGSSLRTHGQSPSEEVLRILSESDILLVPSQIVENQPTVVLEAMSCGLPSIGSSLGGIPETIGDAGVIVEKQTTAAWLETIDRVVDRSCSEWTERATSAWQLHAPDRVVEVLLEAFKSNKKI